MRGRGARTPGRFLWIRTRSARGWMVQCTGVLTVNASPDGQVRPAGSAELSRSGSIWSMVRFLLFRYSGLCTIWA